MTPLVLVRSTFGPSAALRTTLIAIVAGLLAFSALAVTARPVAACSCAAFESVRDYANADNAIFTGIAGMREGRGVPVQVEQWLWGAGAAPIVWLSDESFGDEAGCGVTPPPPGTSWIWVAWRPEDVGDFGTGLCSPHMRLDSPEGQAMLEESIALFGQGKLLGSPEPSEPPATSGEGEAQAGEIPTIALVGGGVALATVALFGGLAFAARRQRPS